MLKPWGAKAGYNTRWEPVLERATIAEASVPCPISRYHVLVTLTIVTSWPLNVPLLNERVIV